MVARNLCITRLSFVLFFNVFSTPIWADAIAVESILLSVHVSEDAFAPLGDQYDRKLDERGRSSVTPGIKMSYDYFLEEPIVYSSIVRASGALYADCLNKNSGFLGIGFRWTFPIWNSDVWNFSIDSGAALIFRETWRSLSNDSSFYTESNDFMPGYQHKWIVVLSTDVTYSINQEFEWVQSIIPALPYVLMYSTGIRYIF